METGYAYELQPVRSVFPDILHNVTMCHPLRHRGKLILFDAT